MRGATRAPDCRGERESVPSCLPACLFDKQAAGCAVPGMLSSHTLRAIQFSISPYASWIKEDGTEKRRIFIDAKYSKVSAASCKQYKQELPRQTDAITDSLNHLGLRQEAEELLYLVADAKEAWLTHIVCKSTLTTP